MKKRWPVLRFLIVLMILYSSAYALKEVALENKIGGLYVAYFNRAPDMQGLHYWKERGEQAEANGEDVGAVLKALSAGFASHPSFERAYGGLDDRAFVEKIYVNALGREGDGPGVDYWTLLLANGMRRSDMVSVFVDAALTFDPSDPWYEGLSRGELDAAQLRQDLISNKVEVALAFVELLGEKTSVQDNDNPETDPAYLASIKVLSEVTEKHTTAEKVIAFLARIYGREDAIGLIMGAGSLLESSFGNTVALYGEILLAATRGADSRKACSTESSRNGR